MRGFADLRLPLEKPHDILQFIRNSHEYIPQVKAGYYSGNKWKNVRGEYPHFQQQFLENGDGLKQVHD